MRAVNKSSMWIRSNCYCRLYQVTNTVFINFAHHVYAAIRVALVEPEADNEVVDGLISHPRRLLETV